MAIGDLGGRVTIIDKTNKLVAQLGDSGDEKKRAEFDRGEIDAEGKPRHPGFDGFPGGFRRSSAGGPGQSEHFEFHFGGGNPFGRGGRAGATNIDPSDFLADLFGGFGAGGAGSAGGRAQGRTQAPPRGSDIAATVGAQVAEGATILVIEALPSQG